jgi:phosphoribosyl 1,2-cyclic phosphodiesterase
MHWDHTEGLPFFTSGDNDGAHVKVLMPDQGDPVTLLERFMSPPFFPIPPSGLRGEWTFDVLQEGKHEIEGYQILARAIPHKGGLTLGFRISDGSGVLAYASDHSPTSKGPGPSGLGEIHEDILELARDATVLIHDAQHTAQEFPPVAHFGHSSIEYAVALAEAAGVERLLLFHHSPARTDHEMDGVLEGLSQASVKVEAAVEGSHLDL